MQDRKKIRILVIDDDDTFRELASMLLAEAGYAIETAEDAIEGGKALLTRNFDLVISDINMPYMNGLELASLLSSDEKTASVPLILASSRMDVETISKAVALRAADYLIKPGLVTDAIGLGLLGLVLLNQIVINPAKAAAAPPAG